MFGWVSVMNNIMSLLEINGKILNLQSQAEKLKPLAVRELRFLGYSYDRIASITGVGKTNCIKYANDENYISGRKAKEGNYGSKYQKVEK